MNQYEKTRRVAKRQRHPSWVKSKQHGVAAIEFAIVFLVLFAILWGILTFGFIFATEQTLALSAENGARAAIRYQIANSPSEGVALRIAAARVSTAFSLQWLQQFYPAYDTDQSVVAQEAPCPYNATLACFTVTASYPYAQHPLIPPLPGLGLIAPAQLTATATMQVDPNNLVQNP